MVLARTDSVPRADYEAALSEREAAQAECRVALARAESAEARLAALEQQLAALKRQRFHCAAFQIRDYTAIRIARTHGIFVVRGAH